jgi:hypothetical protein
MQGDRVRRPFTGTQHDAAGDQGAETDGAQHRKLGQRPDQGHGQQRPARLDVVDEKAGGDRRQREQEEEAGVDQPELLWRQDEILHDRHAGQADDDLVGKIDQHEEEQQDNDGPCASAASADHWLFPQPKIVERSIPFCIATFNSLHTASDR